MVRIEQIEVVIADIPTVRPHVLAMTTMHSQAVVLVFLRRSDGIFGVGEATRSAVSLMVRRARRASRSISKHILRPSCKVVTPMT